MFFCGRDFSSTNPRTDPLVEALDAVASAVWRAQQVEWMKISGAKCIPPSSAIDGRNLANRLMGRLSMVIPLFTGLWRACQVVLRIYEPSTVVASKRWWFHDFIFFTKFLKIFSPQRTWGFMIQFAVAHIFQMGWLNHQLGGKS